MNKEIQKTILMVDDSPLIRAQVKSFLKENFTVIEAANPKECLKILSEKKPKIDLGLIDIEMPEMDGFQLIEMIRKDSAYANVPFIIMTSLHEKENITKAIQIKAHDFIGKPFDKKRLLEKINKHIKD